MTLSWRRLRPGRHSAKHSRHGEAGGDIELTIPSHFRCPISLDLMKDPVTLSTGITYDRQSIEKWIEAGNVTCPTTNQVLTTLEPIPNHTMRKMIQDWCVEKKSFGVERIPTPRIPVSSVEVAEILSRISSSAEKKDEAGCRELVQKVKALTKESERNKRCIVANGAASSLAAAFGAFSTAGSFHENVGVLEEILSALTLIFPLRSEANVYLGSTDSLHCMVRFLDGGDLSQRRNAVLVLKEALSADKQKTDALEEIEGALEALVKLIKEPICPTSTKASLVIIYHMLNSTSSSSRESVKGKFVQMGLVSMLSELVVDAERSICEKALGVLDAICGSKQGREETRDNALIMPVVVKKMLRVSDLATEFAVSILWKLCKKDEREDDEGGLVLEVLQVGAFQKLLLLLQVGCGERTKEKATELLKLLNLHRARLECIESMDFKELKRPF
ncbi:putative aminoacyltransferase, E1 ubiquitin-activating enzyme [Rosa chinensis]|uniref:U-box domain-containing protein n=1 Tax=Rosa chinensis TaxID=74649 RepID=A0A2P6R3K6_ROSCH|nr:U-box domain-containing protein 21 [Rosa chinensis]PRQ41006.1 putative aminoacyltransferase, E1 ubiquitin-activating enzyme [Rosa chinensis]